MAGNFYKLLKRHYIGDALREAGEVVEIKNDDPENGGVKPGTGMVPCDAEGNERHVPVARRGKKPAGEDIG